MPSAPRHDTPAWKAQVWISFGTAAVLCGSGLAWLPVAAIELAFMVMAYGFCLCSAFVLAKSVRDRAAGLPEAPAWRIVAWGGFAMAMGLTLWGLTALRIPSAHAAFLAVGWLYLMSSAFTLAKTLRDAQEQEMSA